MSDLFAFDQQAANPLLDAAKANSIDSFADLEAPAFRGMFSGGGQIAMGELARGGRAFGTLGTGLLNRMAQVLPVESDTPPMSVEQLDKAASDITDPMFKSVDEIAGDAIDYWTPKPNEVGRVGQVLGKLGGSVGLIAAGGGNPAVLAATQSEEGAREALDQGATVRQAVDIGTMRALAAELGVKIPLVGSTLTSRMLTGAAGNVLFGAAERAGEGLVAPELPHVSFLDPVSMTTDALTGLLFGGVAHGLDSLDMRVNPRLTPSEIDAILAARATKSFSEGTAPGKPADIASGIAHQNALETALEQLSRGQAVDVGDVVADSSAHFDDTANLAQSQRLAREVEAGSPKDVPYEEPTPETRAEPPATEEPVSNLSLDEALTAKPEEPAQLPELQALQQLADQRPDTEILSGFDENGEPARMRIADAAEQIHAEYQQAQNDAKAYEAAVSCFLGNGA